MVNEKKQGRDLTLEEIKLIQEFYLNDGAKLVRTPEEAEENKKWSEGLMNEFSLMKAFDIPSGVYIVTINFFNDNYEFEGVKLLDRTLEEFRITKEGKVEYILDADCV